MAHQIAGSIAACLALLLGACGTTDGSGAFAETGLAGNPCRCIREVVRDGELLGHLVPAGCVATSDYLPVCTVMPPAPGTNPHLTP